MWCEFDMQFYEFDQTEFFYFSTPAMSSMDDIGYAYVPSGCVNGTDSTFIADLFYILVLKDYFAIDSQGTKYCDERVSLSFSLSVHKHISDVYNFYVYCCDFTSLSLQYMGGGTKMMWFVTVSSSPIVIGQIYRVDKKIWPPHLKAHIFCLRLVNA